MFWSKVTKIAVVATAISSTWLCEESHAQRPSAPAYSEAEWLSREAHRLNTESQRIDAANAQLGEMSRDALAQIPNLRSRMEQNRRFGAQGLRGADYQRYSENYDSLQREAHMLRAYLDRLAALQRGINADIASFNAAVSQYQTRLQTFRSNTSQSGGGRLEYDDNAPGKPRSR